MNNPPLPNRCTGCGRCIAVCPLRLRSLEPEGFKKRLHFNPDLACSGCRRCADSCPFQSFDLPTAP